MLMDGAEPKWKFVSYKLIYEMNFYFLHGMIILYR